MTTTAATVDTAQIATNVRAEIPAMLDRQSATYTARELGINKWMLAVVEVTHTENTVTIHFPRGKATTAYFLGSALLDQASEHLPLAAGGEIVQDSERTFTLKF